MIQYFFAENNEQKGPFSLDQLRTMGLRPETLVWHEGLADWQRLDRTPDLAAALLAPLQPVPPQPAPPVQNWQPAPPPPGAYPSSATLGYDTTQFGPGGARPASGMAIAALVLGISTFVTCMVPYVGLVSFVTSILAIIFGIIGNSKANSGEAGGKGMAITGMVLGIAYLLIWVILVVIVGVAFIGMSAASK